MSRIVESLKVQLGFEERDVVFLQQQNTKFNEFLEANKNSQKEIHIEARKNLGEAILNNNKQIEDKNVFINELKEAIRKLEA